MVATKQRNVDREAMCLFKMASGSEGGSWLARPVCVYSSQLEMSQDACASLLAHMSNLGTVISDRCTQAVSQVLDYTEKEKRN